MLTSAPGVATGAGAGAGAAAAHGVRGTRRSSPRLVTAQRAVLGCSGALAADRADPRAIGDEIAPSRAGRGRPPAVRIGRPPVGSIGAGLLRKRPRVPTDDYTQSCPRHDLPGGGRRLEASGNSVLSCGVERTSQAVPAPFRRAWVPRRRGCDSGLQPCFDARLTGAASPLERTTTSSCSRGPPPPGTARRPPPGKYWSARLRSPSGQNHLVIDPRSRDARALLTPSSGHVWVLPAAELQSRRQEPRWGRDGHLVTGSFPLTPSSVFNRGFRRYREEFVGKARQELNELSEGFSWVLAPPTVRSSSH